MANTDLVTRDAVKAWEIVQLNDENSSAPPVEQQSYDWIAAKLKTKVMPDACRGSPLSDASAHNLNVSLEELVEHC